MVNFNGNGGLNLVATGSMTCGIQREVRGLPRQMLCGGGSGLKSWINFLPAISPQGTDRKTLILSPHD